MLYKHDICIGCVKFLVAFRPLYYNIKVAVTLCIYYTKQIYHKIIYKLYDTIFPFFFLFAVLSYYFVKTIHLISVTHLYLVKYFFT